MDFDVAIAGGGVAGCAVALALQRQGLSTVIMERAARDNLRVGEHLPPEARTWLHDLGLWESFCADHHLPCPGIHTAWGSPDLHIRDYISNPYGHGWNLNRRRFDASLTNAVVAAGGVVLHNTRLGGVTAHDEGWSMTVAAASKLRVFTAAFLVDATGRAAAAARRLDARQTVHDHLIAVMGWMRAGEEANLAASTLLIEAAQAGWWYATPLPDGRLLAAFMTNPPLATRKAGSLTRYWAEQMEQTHHIRRRAAGFVLEGDVCVKAASSCSCDPVAGEHWLAVGDAAIAFDPLSSMGISKALRMGGAAADVIARTLAGEKNAIAGYRAAVGQEFEKYLIARNFYYSQERRWPDQPFWRRRQVPVGAGGAATR